MGKSNKANRTKGNTRPSSSGHSAQLLNARQLTGFIGFESLEKETASYVPVTGQQVSESTDSSVDSDFRMVMRKMLKRDAITRLKAVQSFGDYCMQKDIKTVKNVLPFWPRLFNKLALDCDRRIREATHHANDKLFMKVKREMAPYLKHIMGVWLLGQCDLYAPASSSAQAAFTTNFQPAKQSEALLFCKNEIFCYFKDNLFEQTAKSMSEPNLTTPEDMENKYILVISASLQALKLFLTSVQLKEHPNIQEEFHSIVAEDKFWKFAKSKEPHIRAAWFALISTICKFIPNVFKELKKKLATTVFSCLSESNPVVARSVWDSALSIVVSYENCWEGLNIHKVALPHVWSLLIKGGKGNAHLLFPCLLPLLSKLPEEVLESEEFHMQFFPSFKKSLMLDTVKASYSELDAILESFFECLQYICLKRLKKMSTGPTLLENILVNEIVPLVDTTLFDPQSSHLATSGFYPLLASFIRKIEAECLNMEEKTSKLFLTTLTTFWGALQPVLTKYFNIPEEMKESILPYMSYFFNCLLHPFNSSKKAKKRTVRFKESEAAENPLPVEQPLEPDGVILSSKHSRSFQVIGDFCTILCEKITANCKLRYLKLFEEIISSASSSDLIEELVKVFSESYTYDSASAFGFFQNVMLKWVEESDNDKDNLECIFNSVFVICSHISTEEAWKILNCSCKTSVVLLEQILQKGLKSYLDVPFFQTWLKTSMWISEIVSGLEELVCGKKFFCDSSAKLPICIYYRILTSCLSDKKHMIDDASFETIVQLMHTLCEQLTSMQANYDIELALDFIHDVTIAISQNPQTCWKFEATSKLVYLLFQINRTDALHFKDGNFISEVLFQILKAFIESYIKTKEEIMSDNGIIFKMATDLNSSIQNMKTQEEASHVLRQCSFLISSVEKAVAQQKPELNSTLFVSYKLMDTMLPDDNYWNSLKQGLQINFLPWILKGKVFYPMVTNEEFSYNEEQTLKITLLSDVISSILSNVIDSSNSDEEESKKFCVHFIDKHIIYLLWFLTFCKGHGIFEVVKGPVYLKLGKNCIKMLSFLPECELDEIKNKIFNLSLTDGSWSLCLQCLGEIFVGSNIQKTSDDLFEITPSLTAKKTVHSYVIRQVLIPYLSAERKLLSLQELLQDLSDMNIYDESNIYDEDFGGKIGELCCHLKCLDGDFSSEIHQFVKKVWLDKGLYWLLNQNEEDPRMINMHDMQMISIFSSVMQYGLDAMIPDHFFVSTVIFQSLRKENKLATYETPKELLLLNQTVNMCSTLSRLLCFIEEDKKESSWKPILQFRQSLSEHMVYLFKHVADIFNKSKPTTEVSEMVLKNVQKAIDYIPGENLVKILVPQEDAPEAEEYASEELSVEALCEDTRDDDNFDRKGVLPTLISSLTSNVRQIQFASHTMLMKIMPLLPNMVAEETRIQSEDETDEEIQTPAKLAPLIKLLCFLNEIVDSMLLDINIGDLCTIMPHTDSYIYAMAYLFAWMEFFEFFAASPPQVRLGYALHLEEKFKLLPALFSNLFRLMPQNPILCLKKGLKVETPKKEDLKLLFIHPPVLKSDVPSSEEIQSIACYVYATALRKVPAVIRTWWNNLDRKSADIVNSFTAKYVSGLLCIEEIQAVHENEKMFENLTVQARPGSREVSATYTIDDCKIELCIQLPPNYPLGPISSERRGRVVIGQQEWRHWLMQLTTVLAYQNGSIVDGLHIWKKNLDKKFEGVEECTICYYILHSSTLKLPKLSCHVCRKKFHSACLYKWFHTSNNSTCPLCRNEFVM